MLGLLLIYFVGKAFYNLAHEHDKSRWGFAILGVISYYVGELFLGIVVGVLSGLDITHFFDDLPTIVLGLMAMPFCILTCWGFYKILENRWENEPKRGSNPETLDGDFIQPNPEP